MHRAPWGWSQARGEPRLRIEFLSLEMFLAGEPKR